MRKTLRRTPTDDQIIERFNRADPDWVTKWDDVELSRRTADAMGNAYLTAPERTSRYSHEWGQLDPPDVSQLTRQLNDQRERDHVDALVENAHRDYVVAAHRGAHARIEARRLKIAGWEMEDIAAAAERAREGLPPLTPDEIEQRDEQRWRADKAELIEQHREDVLQDRWHREDLEELRAKLNAPPSELERARTRLRRMKGQ